MNKLFSIGNFSRNLSALAKISKQKNLIFNGTNQLRLASTQTSTSSAAPSLNEADKPQWERSDRYKIYYGFDANDEAKDKASAHFYTFICFFGFFFVPGVLLYYYPDYKTNDWCYREAHLELARREKAGLPLVDSDYVPSDKIKLPSEEEIGDMKIIL
ncbi:unnamed protein product [Brachionus calyciflorus]|uniref:NADH dehydrogenase [ubiquinone] 1 beta subcomplex subunit 11, mitochondrial n=1 Tax=Brachionus calyciflorus TaxID=104777 RepID=A0A814CHI5_9BILA|nr:unnamed protein product [Brachionus calyciflorus]